jgi:hypothetical protein
MKGAKVSRQQIQTSGRNIEADKCYVAVKATGAESLRTKSLEHVDASVLSRDVRSKWRLGVSFSVQPLCLSCISARCTQCRIHVRTPLTRVVHFAGPYVDPLPFIFVSKLRYEHTLLPSFLPHSWETSQLAATAAAPVSLQLKWLHLEQRRSRTDVCVCVCVCILFFFFFASLRSYNRSSKPWQAVLDHCVYGVQHTGRQLDTTITVHKCGTNMGEISRCRTAECSDGEHRMQWNKADIIQKQENRDIGKLITGRDVSPPCTVASSIWLPLRRYTTTGRVAQVNLLLQPFVGHPGAWWPAHCPSIWQVPGSIPTVATNSTGSR